MLTDLQLSFIITVTGLLIKEWLLRILGILTIQKWEMFHISLVAQTLVDLALANQIAILKKQKEELCRKLFMQQIFIWMRHFPFLMIDFQRLAVFAVRTPGGPITNMSYGHRPLGKA